MNIIKGFDIIEEYYTMDTIEGFDIIEKFYIVTYTKETKNSIIHIFVFDQHQLTGCMRNGCHVGCDISEKLLENFILDSNKNEYVSELPVYGFTRKEINARLTDNLKSKKNNKRKNEILNFVVWDVCSDEIIKRNLKKYQGRNGRKYNIIKSSGNMIFCNRRTFQEFMNELTP